MRRRLDLAGALVADPPIIFLDEPTTGLDPRGRTEMWEVIQNLVAGGTTLLLTTQYLEEADLLADDIVVIDHGKIIAQGTADQLKTQVGGERLELTVRDPARLLDARDLLEPLGVGKAGLDEGRRTLLMPISGGAQVLTEALRVLDDARIGIDDVGLRRPTLDDVFLSLTGRSAEDGGRASPAPDASTDRSRRRGPAGTRPPTSPPREVPDGRPDRASPTPTSSPSATSSRSSASRTCWSSPRCRPSCSSCCSPTCSAGRSPCPAAPTPTRTASSSWPGSSPRP